MSSSSVWVQLCHKGKDERVGRQVQVHQSHLAAGREWNIDALAEAVKAKLKKELDHAGLTEIFVHPPGTKPPFSQANSIRPGKKLLEVIDELENETPPTSDDHPLIVVAPDPTKQPSGDPGYPFNDSIYILYSKPDENEIAVFATAFAATQNSLFLPLSSSGRG